MKHLLVVFVLITGLTGIVQSAPVVAQTSPAIIEFDKPLLLAQQDKKMSPSEAAKKAQSQYGGKVVGTPRCRETESGTVCTVRLDIDGTIKDVTVRG